MRYWGILFILVFVCGCLSTNQRPPPNEIPIISVSEAVKNQGTYTESFITVIGHIDYGMDGCTEMWCPPEKDCCNSCGMDILVQGDGRNIHIGFCSGMDCDIARLNFDKLYCNQNFTFVRDKEYLVTGKLTQKKWKYKTELWLENVTLKERESNE